MNLSPTRIMDLASAFYGSSVLFAASDLGVFAALSADGPADADALAGRLSADRRALRLLLDACVAEGLLAKNGETYGNTPEAEAFLVPGHPGDLSGAIRYNRDVYPAWGRLRDFVRTGLPAEPPEAHLGADPQRTRTFVLAMHARALAIGRAVVPALGISGAARVLDAGGGSGAFAMLVARAAPAARCTVLDLPEVVAIAAELIAREGLGDRVQVLGGDYHTTPFPDRQDVVNFLGVLHQESAEDIVRLLEKAHAALSPGGVVHIMDMMTDATHTAPAFSALFAVNMALTTPHGWVFSDAELRGWMQRAGFTDVVIRPLPPPMPHWLARGRRA